MLKLYQEGLAFIFSAPSGAGKSTIIKALLKNQPELETSISCTTRARRHNETDGVDYHFLTNEDFAELLDKDDLLEHTSIYGNYYGTPKSKAIYILSKGKSVLFAIDWIGAKSIKELLPNAVSIFIMPPSLKVLEERLIARNTDSPEIIARRMQQAIADIANYQYYDYVVVNDQLELAINQVQAIIAAESCKRAHLKLLPAYLLANKLG